MVAQEIEQLHSLVHLVSSKRCISGHLSRAMPRWNDMAGKAGSPAAQHLGGPVHSAHKELTQYFMGDPPTLRLLCLEPATLSAIYEVLCQLDYALGASSINS